jgi:hypothetical protein
MKSMACGKQYKEKTQNMGKKCSHGMCCELKVIPNRMSYSSSQQVVPEDELSRFCHPGSPGRACRPSALGKQVKRDFNEHYFNSILFRFHSLTAFMIRCPS